MYNFSILRVVWLNTHRDSDTIWSLSYRQSTLKEIRDNTSLGVSSKIVRGLGHRGFFRCLKDPEHFVKLPFLLQSKRYNT